MNLLKLADTVESIGDLAFKGPLAWQINGDVAEALSLAPEGTKRGIGDAVDRWFVNGMRYYQAPYYTTSVDASVAIIPESWPEFSLTSDTGGSFRCDLGMVSDGGAYDFEAQMSIGRGETMALAVLSAALRAIHSTQTKGPQS